ncbi:MAG: hypothetical protein HC895_24655 [Leptolyngbyaceae cyanobacterium SM1_3_5]|nr:hypothetical protein [Leptolyngbyaceae cyanobacterium SM1_3_5]
MNDEGAPYPQVKAGSGLARGITSNPCWRNSDGQLLSASADRTVMLWNLNQALVDRACELVGGYLSTTAAVGVRARSLCNERR